MVQKKDIKNNKNGTNSPKFENKTFMISESDPKYLRHMKKNGLAHSTYVRQVKQAGVENNVII